MSDFGYHEDRQGDGDLSVVDVPRQARKNSETGTYHIMVRCINRQTIFEDAEDCDKFIKYNPAK
jgi:hypothetical protein